MAATPKGILGSCADKWIIIGRTQEYSAHHVCNPPMGAAGPIMGPWSITASLVADGTDYKDGTAIQLLVEQTEEPIQIRQPFMEQKGQPLYRRDSYVDV